MLYVLEFVLRVDKDIVEVYRIEIIEVVEEDVIYIALIRSGAIRESEG